MPRAARACLWRRHLAADPQAGRWSCCWQADDSSGAAGAKQDVQTELAHVDEQISSLVEYKKHLLAKLSEQEVGDKVARRPLADTVGAPVQLLHALRAEGRVRPPRVGRRPRSRPARSSHRAERSGVVCLQRCLCSPEHEPRDSQVSVAAALVMGHDVWDLRPAGGGKTLAALMSASYLGGLTVVIVPILALARQWESVANAAVSQCRRDGCEVVFAEVLGRASEREYCPRVGAANVCTATRPRVCISAVAR